MTHTTRCSIVIACRMLGKPRNWYYYRRRDCRRPPRRPKITLDIRELLGASPASYGYRRVQALLRRRGVVCNPKTIWQVMRRQGWLSTRRQRVLRPGRRHEGRVQVPVPNRRWASDITSIQAWDGQKGRLAVMLDCADRMVLAWRFAKRITAEDLAEMLREAVFRRFGEARATARGIEFLSDNGPEYTSHRFRPFVQAMGLVPCHTPRRSTESNGLAEAFFGSFKRDYVYQAFLETLESVAQQLPGWVLHYNQEAPHSALGIQAPAVFYKAWTINNAKLPVQI